MRITSSTTPNLLINTSQNLQSQQAQLELEVSTGNAIQCASDNPIVYGQAVRSQTNLAQLNAYSQAVTQATTLTSTNNQAVTSLHQIVAQAATLATGVNSTDSTADMQDIGTQVTSLINQLVSVANQQNGNNYLFGGTSNQRPIDPTTLTYNANTNGTGQSIDISQNNPLQVGILAGRPGNPATSGFLYDASSGVDVLGALKNFQADLNSGNANAVQNTDLPALNKALDHLSVYVGRTASDMANVQTTGQLLTQQTNYQNTQIGNLTQADAASTLVQLQQIQQQYQSALSAGVRTMQLSILQYLS